MKNSFLIFPVLLILTIFIFVFMPGCIKVAKTISEITISDPTIESVEVFNEKPCNDPDVYDRYCVNKILPEHKWAKVYKYKYRVKGYFNTGEYLKRHPCDAVIQSGRDPDLSIARIWTDSLRKDIK